MQAILYVSHGTRVKKGVQQAEAFIRACMADIPVPIQEICYLELVDPTIKGGIERCIDRGATEILIQPVLLLAAGHVKKDIPAEVEAMRHIYPVVEMIYSEPLGTDPKIMDILSTRIHEKGVPVRGEAAILLVGRGSSDPDIQMAFQEISEALWKKEGLPVQTCFLAACEPSFKCGLALSQASSYKQLFVVPYLMFTGLLMREVEEAIDAIQRPDKTYYLCNPLGSHGNLRQVLVERVNEALAGKVGNRG